MKNGYKRIFWGIFFITFHINLGQFQILPVFIGLLIVVNGVSKLEVEFPSNKFNQANYFAFIASFLSFAGSVLGVFGNDVNASILQFIMLTAFSILELLMEYRILDGSISYMLFCNDTKNVATYTNVTQKYTISFMIYIVLQCIFLTIALDNMLLINTLFAIVLRIWFMQIMSSLKNLVWNKVDTVS